MSRFGVAALASLALLAGCGLDPTEQVLHVRLTMAGDARSGNVDAQGRRTGGEGLSVIRSDSLSLSLDLPVRASHPGEPFHLAPLASRVPTFAGDARLSDDTLWLNVDASEHVTTDMKGHWPAPPPATAANASMTAAVTTLPAGDLEIRVDADWLLGGAASSTRSAFDRSIDGDPVSAWKDCRLSATQARCTLSMRLTTESPEPPPDVQVVYSNQPALASWNRDVHGMHVAWDRDGHFVARADGFPGDTGADALHEVHIVAWTSAPGDSREPPASVPRTPTIAP